MPDLLTLVVVPLIVGVFCLVIEYWIIQPLKGRQTNKAVSSNVTTSGFSFANLAKNILLFSGLVAFLFSISIILGGFKFERFLVGGIPVSLPFQSLLANPLLSDVNISLAAIIYTCIALNVVGFRVRGPRWIRIFTLIILPSALLLLWASVFCREDGFVFLIFLFLSNLWLIGGLVKYTEVGQNQVNMLSLVLFPTNALILIFVAVVPSFWGWLIALAILLLEVNYNSWARKPVQED